MKVELTVKEKALCLKALHILCELSHEYAFIDLLVNLTKTQGIKIDNTADDVLDLIAKLSKF